MKKIRNVEPKENGYELLSKAIVLQAVQDYVRAKRRYDFAEYDFEAKQMMEEAKEFLLSEEISFYTNIDMKWLMERIDRDSTLPLNDLF